MATISEDYCDFETAKLLKEKGMDVSCFNHYTQKNNNDGTCIHNLLRGATYQHVK